MANRTHSRWCFTLNNPTDEERAHVAEFLSSGDRSYGVVGREVGESGTPHLQGFVILSSAQRLSYLRNNLSARAHYEPTRGTSRQASDYCKKDGDFDEYGDVPGNQGRRTDLERLVEWADEFEEANGRPPSDRDIAREQPVAFVKYPRFRELCSLRAAPVRLEYGVPQRWQSELADRLGGDANDRTIDFVVDAEGGKGKTWFCRWLATCRDDVQILGIGKKSDIAHMVDETKRIYLFNVGRNQMEYLSYPLLEAMKDRLLTSTKYSGTTKTWSNNIHVVVLGNELPDFEKLTEDRYNIINMNLIN